MVICYSWAYIDCTRNVGGMPASRLEWVDLISRKSLPSAAIHRCVPQTCPQGFLPRGLLSPFCSYFSVIISAWLLSTCYWMASRRLQEEQNYSSTGTTMTGARYPEGCANVLYNMLRYCLEWPWHAGHHPTECRHWGLVCVTWKAILDGKPGESQGVRFVSPAAFSLPSCWKDQKTALLIYLHNQRTCEPTRTYSICKAGRGCSMPHPAPTLHLAPYWQTR